MHVTRPLVALTFLLTALGWMPVPGGQQQDPPKPKRVEIAITADGFQPGRVDVEAGVTIELVFLRKTDKTCATEVAVPSLKIKKPLALNEPVVIPITPEKKDIDFACGMNMLKGKLVVK